MTGGTDFLTRSEMQKFKDEQQQSMFTTGGVFTTMILPMVAEFRAEAMLGEIGQGFRSKYLGFNAKNIYDSTGLKPTDMESILKKNVRDIHTVPKSQGGLVGADGTRYTYRMSPAEARAKIAKANPLLRQARALKGFARGVGMAELIKVGADLGGMAIDSVMAYRSAPKNIKLSTGPGFFNDTRAAQTQRQRAIQAIHNSQLTTRAALGNEAAFLHI